VRVERGLAVFGPGLAERALLEQPEAVAWAGLRCHSIA
jgi:hypothetical protein